MLFARGVHRVYGSVHTPVVRGEMLQHLEMRFIAVRFGLTRAATRLLVID